LPFYEEKRLNNPDKMLKKVFDPYWRDQVEQNFIKTRCFLIFQLRLHTSLKHKNINFLIKDIKIESSKKFIQSNLLFSFQGNWEKYIHVLNKGKDFFYQTGISLRKLFQSTSN